MKRHTDDPKNSEAATPAVQNKAGEPAKYELPIDFDDILAIAVFDSVVRVKRRRLRSRGTARRPRL